MVKKEYIGLTVYSKKLDKNFTIMPEVEDSYYKSVGLDFVIEEVKEVKEKKRKNDSNNEESE